jgi:hypothetical protein
LPYKQRIERLEHGNFVVEIHAPFPVQQHVADHRGLNTWWRSLVDRRVGWKARGDQLGAFALAPDLYRVVRKQGANGGQGSIGKTTRWRGISLKPDEVKYVRDQRLPLADSEVSFP